MHLEVERKLNVKHEVRGRQYKWNDHERNAVKQVVRHLLYGESIDNSVPTRIRVSVLQDFYHTCVSTYETNVIAGLPDSDDSHCLKSFKAEIVKRENIAKKVKQDVLERVFRNVLDPNWSLKEITSALQVIDHLVYGTSADDIVLEGKKWRMIRYQFAKSCHFCRIVPGDVTLPGMRGGQFKRNIARVKQRSSAKR